MNFKVGQKVVCVNPIIGELKKDKIYTLTSVDSCISCGAVGVCVGIKTHKKKGLGICKCGLILPISGVQYSEECFDASRFAPIIENTSTADIANQIFETCNDVKEIKIPSLV
jgi:hypothetical protein